jgi:hypothetical protein
MREAWRDPMAKPALMIVLSALLLAQGGLLLSRFFIGPK